MKQSIYFLLSLLLMSCSTSAQDVLFTPAEQQQVSIVTPGLFDRSNAFTIDFKSLKSSEYSFPLPVGKASEMTGPALEITTTKGDAIKAMFSGVVRMSRKNAQYGNVVVIRHDNGLETVYANNAQNLVKVGQRVKAGQTIAIVGGTADKAYCMFAIMVNGGWITPSIIIDPRSRRLRRQVVQCRQVGSHVDVSVVSGEKRRGGTLDPDAVEDDPFRKSATFKLNLSEMDNQAWAFPLPDAKVISPYGGKRHHSGVDLKTKPGDKIVAAFDGVVIKSEPFAGYGNCITIRHAYGFETLYSHQRKNFVRVGQKVKAGEVIGLTGRTGRATTEHLHFEVKFKGVRMNPTVIFDCMNHCLQPVTLTLSKNGKVTSQRNN